MFYVISNTDFTDFFLRFFKNFFVILHIKYYNFVLNNLYMHI